MCKTTYTNDDSEPSLNRAVKEVRNLLVMHYQVPVQTWQISANTSDACLITISIMALTYQYNLKDHIHKQKRKRSCVHEGSIDKISHHYKIPSLCEDSQKTREISQIKMFPSCFESASTFFTVSPSIFFLNSEQSRSSGGGDMFA